MALAPALCLSVAPCPSPEDVPQLLDVLRAAFPLSENESYLRALSGSDRPAQVLCERVGALSLLPSVLRRSGFATDGLILARDPHGRPFLTDRAGGRAVDVNLSHSAAHVACAAVPFPYRVGVDVEEPVPATRAERLSKRFCTEGEHRLLDGSIPLPGVPLSPTRADLVPDFTCLWTLREAMAKYVGSGEPLRFDVATPVVGVRLTVMRLPDTGAYLSLCFSGEITAPVMVSDGSAQPEILSDTLVT